MIVKKVCKFNDPTDVPIKSERNSVSAELDKL